MSESQPTEQQHIEQQYYFINDTLANHKYETIQPSFRDDVIRQYDLLTLSESIARTNPDGSKGVKLRKSYKNHITDLPYKLTIPSDRKLSSIVTIPENPDMPNNADIQPFNENDLRSVFNFEKSGINGVPGFDPSLLALRLDGSSSNGNAKKRKVGSNTPNSTPSDQPDLKRRHVQVHFD